MNRFYFDNTQINGYWAIRSNNDEDIIWIDCPKKYLKTIIDALNKIFK